MKLYREAGGRSHPDDLPLIIAVSLSVGIVKGHPGDLPLIIAVSLSAIALFDGLLYHCDCDNEASPGPSRPTPVVCRAVPRAAPPHCTPFLFLVRRAIVELLSHNSFAYGYGDWNYERHYDWHLLAFVRGQE